MDGSNAETKSFYYGHYQVYRDGRIKNSRGKWLTPVMPPGYSEAAYNLRHKKKAERVKVRTILKITWGLDVSSEQFSMAWIHRVRQKNGLKPAVKSTTGRAWKQHVMSSEEWWNQIEYTPGCQGPADPIYCPLEQRLGTATPLPGGIILL